jgi:tripartite-type tricarboxylate transporter receptor subunit TctC
MKMDASRRLILTGAAAFSALPWTARAVDAADWPRGTVRIVVGLPPGGGIDAVARILADGLSTLWGAPVIVENRPGAGGNIANSAVAHAAPDGQTILLPADPPALKGLMSSSLNYDPVADFAPVTQVDKYPYLMVVPNSSAARTLPEFIALAKASPGTISFASTGVGTGSHLVGEMFQRAAGISLIHVPYTGVGPAMADLASGRLGAMFNAISSLLPLAKAGQVRALGVTTAERFASAPDIPTINESGAPGVNQAGGHGLYVPAKTPPVVVDRIYAGVSAILADAAVREKFAPLGVTVMGAPPGELAAASRKAIQDFGPIITAKKIGSE